MGDAVGTSGFRPTLRTRTARRTVESCMFGVGRQGIDLDCRVLDSSGKAVQL